MFCWRQHFVILVNVFRRGSNLYILFQYEIIFPSCILASKQSATTWRKMCLYTDIFTKGVRKQRLPDFVFTVPGITETVSQLISGWIADQNWIKKYQYHKSYLILCGVTNLLAPLATTFPLLMAYTIFFAIFAGGYLALILPVLVSRLIH